MVDMSPVGERFAHKKRRQKYIGAKYPVPGGAWLLPDAAVAAPRRPRRVAGAVPPVPRRVAGAVPLVPRRVARARSCDA
jgi:hypothetical protein